jgi:hypothetical protein
MGFIRDINAIHKIDRATPGATLYASRTSPGNTLGKSGWNELAETVNALQEWGNTVSLCARVNGKYDHPYCGNFGPSHTQDALREAGEIFELIPGQDYYTLILETMLHNRWNGAAGAQGNQYISVDLINGGVVHNIINLCGFSAAADLAQFPGVNFTIETSAALGKIIFVKTGQINTPGVMPGTGVTMQGYLRIRHIQSNPKTIGGLWDNYADGFIKGTFRMHANRV